MSAEDDRANDLVMEPDINVWIVRMIHTAWTKGMDSPEYAHLKAVTVAEYPYPLLLDNLISAELWCKYALANATFTTPTEVVTSEMHGVEAEMAPLHESELYPFKEKNRP